MMTIVKVYCSRQKLSRTIEHRNYWYFNINLNYNPIFSRISHFSRPVSDNMEKLFSEIDDQVANRFIDIFN